MLPVNTSDSWYQTIAGRAPNRQHGIGGGGWGREVRARDRERSPEGLSIVPGET